MIPVSRNTEVLVCQFRHLKYCPVFSSFFGLELLDRKLETFKSLEVSEINLLLSV